MGLDEASRSVVQFEVVLCGEGRKGPETWVSIQRGQRV